MSEFTEDDVRLAERFPAAPMMIKMLGTHYERRGQYGASEQKFADLCVAAFPNGLTLKTREDWLRFGLLSPIISKLARYTHDFQNPHVDSMHDIGPYSAMLEAEDRRLLGMMPFPPRTKP